MSKSPITCHVLDAAGGRPAAGVTVSLEVLSLDGFENTDMNPTDHELPQTLARGSTNDDGRCTDLLHHDDFLAAGIYKMTFHTGPYFKSLGVKTFYPWVEVTFNYSDQNQHYHIPLLISPFSYTTYRGS